MDIEGPEDEQGAEKEQHCSGCEGCTSASHGLKLRSACSSGQGTFANTGPDHQPGTWYLRYQVPISVNPHFTAFFTSVRIFVSSAAVKFLSANATGHMVPWSRFALSLKPNIAYLSLNLSALRKKQTTLPFFA